MSSSSDEDSDHQQDKRSSSSGSGSGTGSGSDSEDVDSLVDRAGKSGGRSSPMRIKHISPSTSKTMNGVVGSPGKRPGPKSKTVGVELTPTKRPGPKSRTQSPEKRPGPRSKTCPDLSKGESGKANPVKSRPPQLRKELQLSESDSDSNSDSDSDCPFPINPRITPGSSGNVGHPQKKQQPQRRAIQNNSSSKRQRSSSSSSGGQGQGQQKGRKKGESESGDSDGDGLWLPDRKAVKNRKPNYVEMSSSSDSDEMIPVKPVDNSLKIDRVMDGRMGKVGATGEKTVFYVVDEYGDPNETLPEDTPLERQFLIKWVGQSDLHNTWESEKSIQRLKLGKSVPLKLTNFIRKEDDWNYWKKKADPEEIEYEECQVQMEKELTKSYAKAERIIAQDILDDESVEYFVKWECLPYEDATWETGQLITNYFPDKVSIFKKQLKSVKIPSKSRDFNADPPTFTQVKTQPDFMKGADKSLVLRDYQMDGVNWMVHAWYRNKSVILGDEMGLGKTIQAICFLNQLFESYSCYGPFLLVVPLSTMSAWQKEFGLWAPKLNVLTYIGNEKSRGIIREHEWLVAGTNNIKFNALLTTYETIVRDSWFLCKRPWAVTIVDEAHRLKNRESGWHSTLAQFKSKHIVLMTGTPIQNSLEELWSLLHFIMPHKFNDWESFERSHSLTSGSDYRRLHLILEPYILRRVKKDVEKSLPLKHEKILRVEMTADQRQIYKWILTKNYAALKKEGGGSRQSFMNVCMQLRKCCNHAILCKSGIGGFNPKAKGEEVIQELLGGSGKLILLDKLLVRLKSMGSRVLIFSQFVIMLDIIEELLQLRRFSFQRLDGNITGDRRVQALNQFNQPNSKDFCFLLSTRAGGLGINLASANTVIIFDSDWNPQNDLQAQARAHRIGQTRQVNVYRFVTKNTVEESIVEKAKKKMVLDHLVIQRMDTTGRTVLGGPSTTSSRAKAAKDNETFDKDELNAILKFGAEQLFKAEDGKDGGTGGSGEFVCDIDEILRVADAEAPSAGEGGDVPQAPGDELLSAFKVVSFANDAKDWDEIIPEGLRGNWILEEKERERLEQLSLQRSSRKGRKKNYIHKNSPKKKRRRGSDGEEVDDGGSDFDVQEVTDSGSDSDKEADGEDGKGGKIGIFKKGEKALTLNGLTEEEVKRFVGSLKKFPMPLMRMDVVGKDAELDMEKHTEEELIFLAQHILKSSQESIERMEKERQDAKMLKAKELMAKNATIDLTDGTGAGTSTVTTDKNKKKGGKVKAANSLWWVRPFPRYKINGATMLRQMKILEPLGQIIPLDASLRSQWKWEIQGIRNNFDEEWGPEEDTQLLLGVWEFGFCTELNQNKVVSNMKSFMSIMDTYPLLKQKIHLEGEAKPQMSDVLSRVYDLLLCIKQRILVVQRPPMLTKTIAEVERQQPVDQGPLTEFTKEEVGRFLNCLRHFPHAMKRLKEVRMKEQLEGKSEKELRVLGQFILQKCKEAKAKADAKMEEQLTAFQNGTATKKKINQRIQISLKGNTFCPKQVLNRMEDWDGLAKLIAPKGKKIEGWRLQIPVHTPNWPNVIWGTEEDSRLLLGIWTHGQTNLVNIRRSDPLMSTKIDFAEDGVSEIRVQMRVQTLLNAIKKHQAKPTKGKGVGTPGPGPKSKKVIALQNGLPSTSRSGMSPSQVVPGSSSGAGWVDTSGGGGGVKPRGRPVGTRGPPKPKKPKGPVGRPRSRAGSTVSRSFSTPTPSPGSPLMSVSDEEECLRTEFPEMGFKKLRVHMERMSPADVAKYSPPERKQERETDLEFESEFDAESPRSLISGDIPECPEDAVTMPLEDDDDLEILEFPPVTQTLETPVLQAPIILISSDDEDDFK